MNGEYAQTQHGSDKRLSYEMRMEQFESSHNQPCLRDEMLKYVNFWDKM